MQLGERGPGPASSAPSDTEAASVKDSNGKLLLDPINIAPQQLLSPGSFRVFESRRKRACESCRDKHRACDGDKPCVSCRSLGMHCRMAKTSLQRAEPGYVNLDSEPQGAGPNSTKITRQEVPTGLFFMFKVDRSQQPSRKSLRFDWRLSGGAPRNDTGLLHTSPKGQSHASRDRWSGTGSGCRAGWDGCVCEHAPLWL